jgi:hypothetical protein
LIAAIFGFSVLLAGDITRDIHASLQAAHKYYAVILLSRLRRD